MAKKQAFVSASEFIATKRASVAYDQQQLRNMRNSKALVGAMSVVNKVIGAIVRNNGSENMSHYAYACASGYDASDAITVDVNITLMNVLALDAAEVGFAVNAIRSAGFARDGELEKVASEYVAFAKWKFANTFADVKVRIDMKAELAKEGTAGATCRKVQVGTELKEVPKFAIVCD